MATVCPCYPQGYCFLQCDDCVVTRFVDARQRFFNPANIWYELGLVTIEDGLYHRICVDVRLPFECSVGVWRPNFCIGDTWPTGRYELRWYFQVNDGDPIQERVVEFCVCSTGLSDNEIHQLSYFDLPADLQIILNPLSTFDLPAALQIIP